MENLLEFDKSGTSIQKNKPITMTLAAFVHWVKEKCGTEYNNRDERVNCVTSIDHIEPGYCVALYATPSAEGMENFEMDNYFPCKTKGGEALQCNVDTYPPMVFEEWVRQQYITDKGA